MKTYTFTHRGELLSLNKALGLATSPGKGHLMINSRKKKMEQAVAWSIKRQLPGVTIDGPFATVFTWYAKNRRQDPDNIASAVKYLFDAAQDCGLLANDSWKYTAGGFMHRFRVSPDKKERVTITFMIGAQLNIPGIADDETDKLLFDNE